MKSILAVGLGVGLAIIIVVFTIKLSPVQAMNGCNDLSFKFGDMSRMHSGQSALWCCINTESTNAVVFSTLNKQLRFGVTVIQHLSLAVVAQKQPIPLLRVMGINTSPGDSFLRSVMKRE